METNLHLDEKTEISSPIKDAIASHINKFYPTPKVRLVEDKEDSSKEEKV